MTQRPFALLDVVRRKGEPGTGKFWAGMVGDDIDGQRGWVQWPLLGEHQWRAELYADLEPDPQGFAVMMAGIEDASNLNRD